MELVAEGFKGLVILVILAAILIGVFANASPQNQQMISDLISDIADDAGYNHAIRRHPQEEVDAIRNCIQQGGYSVKWHNPITNRNAYGCLTTFGWGTYIEDATNGSMVTAFIRYSAKSLQDLLDYFTRRGYKP